MLASTHIITGVVIATLLEGNLAAMAITGVFAILPDIDTVNSTFGRRIPVIPLLLKHRGITPFTLMLLVVYALTDHTWRCLTFIVPWAGHHT